MAQAERLFKIDSSNGAEAVAEVDFAKLGFQERRDIQEWVAKNPSILGEELLIVGKEFSGFDRTNERADLVAVDRYGKVVVIELKRDDSGADVHWQAIKYASYFSHATPDVFVRMLAEHRGISAEKAADTLKRHLEADDLDTLNNGQRILLVSHRFAPEVTSAVLWVNENAVIKDLITCVQLTPYQDAESDAFYIHAATILPVPGMEQFAISTGVPQPGGPRRWTAGPVKKDDAITAFLREVADEASQGLPDDLRPDKWSRWAGVGGGHRYYHVWYARPPWDNWGLSYQMMLSEEVEEPVVKVTLRFECDRDYLVGKQGFSEHDLKSLRDGLENLRIFSDQNVSEESRWILSSVVYAGSGLDGSLRSSLVSGLRGFIESVTPLVTQIENSRNEQAMRVVS